MTSGEAQADPEGGKGGSEEVTESRVRSEGHCSQSRPGDFIPCLSVLTLI